MTDSWSGEQLDRIGQSGELQIASRDTDGALRKWVSIWVVCVDDAVYVRTWYRRTTGWFGDVLELHQARIRVPGLEVDVLITDVGEGPPDSVRALTPRTARSTAPPATNPWSPPTPQPPLCDWTRSKNRTHLGGTARASSRQMCAFRTRAS
jgi:hypothetical protein